MTTNNEAFDKWWNDNPNRKSISDSDKQFALNVWYSATTEANKRIAELEVQLQNWKDFSKKVQKIDFNDYLQLQASNNHLRKAGQALIDRWDCPKWKDVEHTGFFIDALRRALAATPAESLQAHDNELLERAASIVQNKIGSTDEAPLSDAVTEILALKEVK